MTQIALENTFFVVTSCAFFKSSLEKKSEKMTTLYAFNFFYKRKLFTVCVRIVFIVGSIYIFLNICITKCLKR
jgi:hypothetical protein